ncbi:MAG: phytanoyl-CoA dioxygenase family protein [Anaerolineae bacterium]|nr:phytanoyl-CoA dioxygenase family protein [Anaerolineae bacterium]MCO5189559.1 phytanoyl-CoA dioxygenase family protein [Anaerolineae bacterium]MCO5196874.1 phytanoyl-CoA dioxygenase family protein [Anaerolineae bacterium]
MSQPELYSNGVKMDLSPNKFGELRESNDILHDGAALRERMTQDGYLFFRELVDPNVVLTARREILLKYATVGEIDAINHDVMEAIQSEHTFVDKVNLRAFTESVRTGLAYENVVLSEAVIGYLERLLGSEVRPYDFRWPRFVRPGEGCGFHADGPYMNRGTDKVFTTWIPLGRVRREEGALIVLENSHANERLLNTYAKQDADKEKISWLSTNPLILQEQLGGRWLSTDFNPGDVLSFGMHTIHGALDNRSPIGRCRLTSDTRYQRADEPLDERWNGANPEAHGYDKVFFPGLGSWNNIEFHDEWKPVDEWGRLVIPT